jgi:hypothetical protein
MKRLPDADLDRVAGDDLALPLRKLLLIRCLILAAALSLKGMEIRSQNDQGNYATTALIIKLLTGVSPTG